MLKLAKLIRVERVQHQGSTSFRLIIDGEEFPYYLADSGIDVKVDDGMPSATIEILADRVEVVDDVADSTAQLRKRTRRAVPSVDQSEVRDALSARGHVGSTGNSTGPHLRMEFAPDPSSAQ